jgi:hypothetical protein
MMVFDRIKQSIHSGEADGAILKYGLVPEDIRKRTALLAA